MNTKDYNLSVEDYSGRVYRFAKKLLHDDEEAADIVQDSFLRLWENIGKVEKEKVKSWLFTTAYRQALLRIKLKNRNTDQKALKHLSYEMPNYDLKEVIQECLSELPEIQKSILMLRDYEGYDYKEIGEILELNESQVKVYLFRARSKMQAIIKDLNLVI